MWSRLVVLGVALAVAPWASAEVFKCKGVSGETVYSQAPCSAGAAPMKLRSNRAATESSGEAANRAAVYQTTELADAGIAERNCLSSEQSRIYGPVNARGQDVSRQIAALNRELATARNNLAGATYASGIRSQIASLQQAQTADRISADSQMAEARRRCGETRSERERATREKYSGAGTP
ncbi:MULTISPECIES: DUF4124 domain-containing protein [Stenotrophomonas]|jgi:hypothetical protein|nr:MULTISPECIES: DUF4124 domain-containing protein [Stenotrophomonas]MBA0255531.1 DUF4124 domain-containing protein [Stenotrophomonas maltophilia]MBA0480197.1 DUF4124 domain-containing protein [Stenotrophomonas maltophilia]MBA0488936.1 DUF4124 domain-containing protein [Stenotrophomonas maltophilia]MBA0492928.1 DUF4124 domain-containing protein [Stenotrophomonas maltophilia]MBH1853049.1 DUF4124 domain-containing protein [Stenotrophomonas maltophilia]